MSIIEESPIAIAEPPFNDASDLADLVIRTSDNVDFFVHRALLLFRSPSSFFRHALDGNHHTEEKDSLPVLEANEDSTTFRHVLIFCYPYNTPELTSVEQLSAVGTALDKYCMDHAFERFIQTVIASPHIKQQPLRVFAVAVAHGWKELGETAARNSLGIPLDGDVKELDGISARHLQRLLNYHKLCGEATQIQWMSWLAEEQSEILQNIPRRQRCSKSLPKVPTNDEFYSYRWLINSYLQPVKEKMLVDPRPQVAFDDGIIREAILASIRERNTDAWIKAASSHIHRLAQLLATEVDRRISEIPLEIKWRK